MATAITIGSVLYGTSARGVAVRATLSASRQGGLRIEGLSDAQAAEARVRVSAAADLSHAIDVAVEGGLRPGEGAASLDLAIAVAALRAVGVPVPSVPTDAVLVGELALDGNLRPLRGALCHVRDAGSRSVVLPTASGWEAGLWTGADARTAGSLSDVVAAAQLPRVGPSEAAPTLYDPPILSGALGRVQAACRGLDRVLLVAPLGAGTTLLARGLAPEPLSRADLVEVVAIHGAAGLVSGPRGGERPFRAPHHSVSERGLVGDAARPGELALAHRGVLFLDELPEFRGAAVQSLGAALARGEYRPRCVVATALPCPCGYAGHLDRSCRCPEPSIARFQSRVAELAKALGLTRVELDR